MLFGAGKAQEEHKMFAFLPSVDGFIVIIQPTPHYMYIKRHGGSIFSGYE